jgi:hypothetical protein
MMTFDDFETSELRPPIPTDTTPSVGEILDGKKVLRVKPISAMSLTKLACAATPVEISSQLKFKRHDSRPFVFWLAEVEL